MKVVVRERKVTLVIRFQFGNKVVRKTVAYGKTGRVVPGLVIIGGKEIRLDNPAYEVRYYVKGQPKYLPAGNNASDAEELRARTASQLTAKAFADAAGLKTDLQPSRKTIKQSKSEYLTERSVDLQEDQIKRYGFVMALWGEVCKKIYVDEITRTDLLNFIVLVTTLPVYRNLRRKPSTRRNAAQRRKRYPVKIGTVSARTVFNYYVVLCKWLKDIGVDPSIFPDPPEFEEPVITVYSPEQIKIVLSLATGSLRIALSLMLKCGLRRREVAYSYFSDIDFSKRTFVVRGKPEWDFRIKNYMQREVPIPDDLFEELSQWKETHPHQALIVPNVNGKPDLRLIRKVKRFAYLHGLRCGRCAHCCSGNPDCEEWELHKFRRTYATALVRHVDLRTAQRYLGHKRITSTERYFLAASAADGQKRVSEIDFTRPFYEVASKEPKTEASCQPNEATDCNPDVNGRNAA